MSNNKTPDMTRRNFLGGVGTAVVSTAAIVTPGVQLEAGQKKAPRWAMVMDLRRCIGCRACTVACKAENDVSLGRFRAVIQEKTMGTFPDTKKAFLPLMCNHCEGNKEDGVPPCVKSCPQFPGDRAKFKTAEGKTIRYRSGGTYKRPDGAILIDVAQCIGCGKCIDSCPYGVRSFNPNTDPDAKNIWWNKHGTHPNSIIPNKSDPISGGQRWMDTVVQVAKV